MLTSGVLPNRSNPIRANQSSKLEPLDPRCPRSISALSYSRSGFPPPPSVEDEVESLAKECDVSVVSVGDEEPKCRGAIDQQPILLEVPDFEDNCERRYVILTPSETTDNSSSDRSQAGRKPDLSQRTEYAANTKIQLDPHVEKDTTPAIQRRKSRADLPKLETHTPSTRPKTPSDLHRAMSATYVDHKVPDERDYFSPHPESARPAGDAYLSPVIKHATKGRDRAYWNFNSGSTVSSPRGSTIDLKPSSSDRKGTNGYARSSPLSRPGMERRTHSAMDVPRESKKTADRHSLYKDESFSRSRRSLLPSPPLEQRPSSSRSTRREHSPARSHREKPKLSRRKSSHKHRSSPSREKDDGYSSDEHRDHKSHRSHRHRRKSLVVQEDRPSLPSPTVASIRSKSRPPSPLASPRASRGRSPDYAYETNPRGSTATLTKRRNDIERPVSPVSSGSSSSPRSRSRRRADSTHGFRPRTLSRSPSIMSTTSTSKTADVLYGSAPLSMILATDDRKRQTMPPSPAYSRQGSLEDVHRPSHNWQPEPLLTTPRQSATNLERLPAPIVSFRRFAEDVNAGINPGLPICPRQRPRAGYSDWLTLPRSENFNICPTCYEQVFQATEFRDLFVPASFRSKEREIVCDFGTSTWYRSAWLMTRKYHRQDLRLLQGVADVMARERVPCYGNTRVSRIWYSITDPSTRRCIPDFNVCSPCAKAIEVLFPSLMGIFVPLDRTAEAKSGKCSLHFAPKRNRFLTYFDTFEKCHDRAMAERSAPDSKRLAFNINSWSEVAECPQDKHLRYEYWYTMADIPEMTVCEECFLDVVYPELAADLEARTATGIENSANAVARNFYTQPYLIRSSTVCRMSSPWMRQLFKTACRKEKGIPYMSEKVRERLGTF